MRVRDSGAAVGGLWGLAAQPRESGGCRRDASPCRFYRLEGPAHGALSLPYKARAHSGLSVCRWLAERGFPEWLAGKPWRFVPRTHGFAQAEGPDVSCGGPSLWCSEVSSTRGCKACGLCVATGAASSSGGWGQARGPPGL